MSAASLTVALEDAMELVAISRDQRQVVTEALDIVKRAANNNRAMVDIERRLCGHLDALARQPDTGALTVKAIARTLRPALKVLADPQATAAERIIAYRTVDDITALVPRDRLSSPSLRHELRAKAMRTLANHLTREQVTA